MKITYMDQATFSYSFLYCRYFIFLPAREWEEETSKARRRLEEEREEMERRREQHLREIQQFEGVLDGVGHCSITHILWH